MVKPPAFSAAPPPPPQALTMPDMMSAFAAMETEVTQCHKLFLNPHESVRKVFQQIIVIMTILNGAMKVP